MTSPGVVLRPRYGRITALAAATSTTLVSIVGTVVESRGDEAAGGRAAMSLAGAHTRSEPDAATSSALASASSTGVRASLSVGLADRSAAPPPGAEQPPAPPRHSGTGRRVVFSESQQRVWLVGSDGDVRRTYLVSGSLYDNLDPGSYEVYSRSMNAVGVDGSDLRYMVRFAQGWNDPIGFHWIPRMNGERMQTRAELGTPQSHGCVRQAAPDARALWRFAPVGTPVVVTA
jgi:hypothetical protein